MTCQGEMEPTAIGGVLGSKVIFYDVFIIYQRISKGCKVGDRAAEVGLTYRIAS